MSRSTEMQPESETPDKDVATQAAQAAELLQAYLSGHDDAAASLQFRAADRAHDPQPIDLPAPAVALLREILSQLANGHVVTVAPARKELTTQQAADLLNVSRPYLVALLDSRAIPFSARGKPPARKAH